MDRTQTDNSDIHFMQTVKHTPTHRVFRSVIEWTGLDTARMTLNLIHILILILHTSIYINIQLAIQIANANIFLPPHPLLSTKQQLDTVKRTMRA